MELMKFDMGGGAAAVLGAARTTALLQPDGVEVRFGAGEAQVRVRALLQPRSIEDRIRDPNPNCNPHMG